MGMFTTQPIPDQWDVRWSQPDPMGITIRPLQPDDIALIHAMHGRLSPDSLYDRYLQRHSPTLDEIAAVCRLDPARGAGFVATVEQAGVVGIAYYVREAHTLRPTAEPGILVEDRFQGQGIGRNLWQRLQLHAQAHQIRRLRVFLHPSNRRMQRLLQGGGFPYTTQAYGGLYEYLVALDGRPQLASPVLAQTPVSGLGHSRQDHPDRRWQLAPPIAVKSRTTV